MQTSLGEIAKQAKQRQRFTNLHQIIDAEFLTDSFKRLNKKAAVGIDYVLDLWFEKVVKKHCEGEAYLVRYADDFVAIFRYKKDAEKYYKTLGKRLGNKS